MAIGKITIPGGLVLERGDITDNKKIAEGIIVSGKYKPEILQNSTQVSLAIGKYLVKLVVEEDGKTAKILWTPNTDVKVNPFAGITRNSSPKTDLEGKMPGDYDLITQINDIDGRFILEAIYYFLELS